MRDVSPQEFGVMLANAISAKAMITREFRSVANSIGFPLGVYIPIFGFSRVQNSIFMVREMTFLYAFLGTLVLRACLDDARVSEPIIEAVVSAYQRRLLNQWLIKDMVLEYSEREMEYSKILPTVEELGQDLDKPEHDIDPFSHVSALVGSFYFHLTGEEPDALKTMMLIRRLGEYLQRFLLTVTNMLSEFSIKMA